MASPKFKRVLLALLAAGSSAAPSDADVAAYAAAVAAAGGTLPGTHLSALNANIAALKASGAWTLIKELWLPLGNAGDLTTAAVKFKNGATSASVTLTNFVSGDFTLALGMDPGVGNAGSKRIVTDFAPSTSATNGALSAASWGYSCYQTRIRGNANSFSTVVMGTSANTLSYIQSGSSSKISGGTVDTRVGDGTRSFSVLRLTTIQQDSGNTSAYFGGYQVGTVANGAPTLPAGAISVLSANGAFFGDCAVSGYAIHAGLSAAQLRALQTFIDSVYTAIGRVVFSENLAAVGDSYVAAAPTGPSDVAHDYIALVGTAKGWGYSLRGTAGIGWAAGSTTMVGTTGINVIIAQILNQPTKRILFPLGINDANTAGTGAALTASAQVLITLLLQHGIPASYIRLGTLYPWTGLPDQVLAASIAQATRDLATANGLQLVDFFTGSTAGVTAYEVGIHKNDAGHAALASDLTAEITANPW